jgi:hypothetical protein
MTIPDERRYQYFVSYASELRSGRIGYGQAMIGSVRPMGTFDDINQLRQTICEGPEAADLNPDKVVILNYILVSGPDDDLLADFARWLLTLDDPDDEQGRADRQRVNLTQIIGRAREALGVAEPNCDRCEATGIHTFDAGCRHRRPDEMLARCHNPGHQHLTRDSADECDRPVTS